MHSYVFGLQSFHVDNCRSKGDHNDSDWLTVTVSTEQRVFQSQVIPLGDNLHAGDLTTHAYAGPFDIDDNDVVTVTYFVVNLAHSAASDQRGQAEQIALGVGSAVLAALAGVGAWATFKSALNLQALNGLLSGILGAASGVLSGIAGILGWSPSDPNCNGEVFTRVFTYAPGHLSQQAPLIVGPATETARSPSECGNDPHSTVVYCVQEVQHGWRSCSKCQSLFFGPFKDRSHCPQGGTHDDAGSFNYFAAFGGPPRDRLQVGWRSCPKCQSLFFGPFKNGSHCPQGGTHDDAGSFDYVTIFGEPARERVQVGWRACPKCQGFFYGPFKDRSRCAGGGTHDDARSFDYIAAFTL